MLKNSSDAQDLAQEIMLFVLLRISSYQFRSKFSTWLYVVVKNKCIDVLRKSKRSSYMIISASLADELEDIPEVEEDHLYEQLEFILAKLTKAEALLISERFIEKKSFKELALDLCISPSAVKMKMGRLKKKIQKLLKTQSC